MNSQNKRMLRTAFEKEVKKVFLTDGRNQEKIVKNLHLFYMTKRYDRIAIMGKLKELVPVVSSEEDTVKKYLAEIYLSTESDGTTVDYSKLNVNLEEFMQNVELSSVFQCFNEKTMDNLYKFLVEGNPLHDNFREGQDWNLLKGAIQAGKTNAQIYFMMKGIFFFKKKVIYTCRDATLDATQAIKQINTFLREKLYPFMVVHGYPGFSLKVASINTMDEFFSKTQEGCDILVLMANGAQLSKFNKRYEDDDAPFLYLSFFDEGDQTLTVEESGALRGVYQNMIDFTERSSGRLATSATPEAFVFSELYNTPLKNTMTLPISPEYIMFNTIKEQPELRNRKLVIKLVDQDEKQSKKYNGNYVVDKTRNILEQDMFVKPFLNNLAVEPVFKNSIDGKEDHPIITVINNSSIKRHHGDVFDYIKEKYPTKFAVYQIQGSKSSLHCNLLTADSIIINKIKYIKNENGVYVGKTLLPSSIITYLFEVLKGVQRLVIVGHQLLQRAVNIASENYKLHITHMYIRCTKKSFSTNAMQMLRILGIQKLTDNTPRTLSITEHDYEELQKYYEYQNKLFDQFGKQTQENEYQSCYNYTKSLSIWKKHLPKNQMSRTKNPSKIVKNERDDNFYEHEETSDRERMFVGGEGNNNRLIDDNDLNGWQKEYVKLIIQYLTDKYENREVWVRRAEILPFIMRNHPEKTEQNIQGSLSIVCSDKSKVAHENDRGLLCSKNGNEWVFKLVA